MESSSYDNTSQPTSSTPLSKALYEELGAAVRGGVYPRSDVNFADYSKLFNGNVKTLAKVVVCPLDAEDVSRVIVFCTKHNLYPSVKAGGYGTAGWAIGGDVIVDVSKLVDVDIETPQTGGGYTSLRDSAFPASKGKGRVGQSAINISTSGKRRRQDDDDLRSYDSASGAVAGFLKGPPLPVENSDVPSPNVRRRLNPEPATREVSMESNSSENRSTSESGSQSSSSRDRALSSNEEIQTDATSPSPPAEKQTAIPSSSSSGADPFGYMNLGPSLSYQPSSSAQSLLRSFGPSSAALFAAPGPIAAPYTQLTRAIPIHQHAYVTFGAGMRQKEIDRYTAENPLESTSMSGSRGYIPYHVPFAAHPVGSSVMILGGFGFQSRLRGLSIDNLVEVEMVLADGRIVIVNEHEHPDLWWAIRGAGPAFGVVTRYKAKAFPIPVVFAGNLIYRFHRATAPSLIKHFRDCIKGAPRELYANVLLTAGPAGKDSLVVIQICYMGPKEEGQEYLKAISSWDGERCLLNEVDEKSFLNQQDSVAQVLRGKAGRQWFIRSALITSLPDDIINQTVMQFSTGPTGCTWLFELAGGAVSDFENNCVPKSQREASFNVAALHQWEIDVHDERCVSTAEKWISETLIPVNSGGPIPSFLGRHEPPERTMACFGDNWSRLVSTKNKYDPTGLFKNSFWPLDILGNPREARAHEPPTP